MTAVLKNTIAPSLPNATKEFDEQYVNQFNNILRLYFNTIDGFNTGLVAANGGKELSFPHIAASDSTDQYATANNTPTVVQFNALETGSGFVFTAPGNAYPQQTGVYKITYSAQLANTANASHDAVFWLRVDGVDVPRSATTFSVPARKSAGVPSFICGYSEVVFVIDTESVVELVWATELAYRPVGPVDGVYIHADAAQTSPYIRPSIPSIIGSITYISRV